MQEWIVAERPAPGGAVRGPRHRRQGRRDQAHHRLPEPAHLPRRRACPTPSERERTQWYFQRYVAHLPAAGEIVLFDRSWYNRAGVEHVMGFCTRGRVRGVPALLPAVRAGAAERRDHARQVLAVGQRRGAGAALREAAVATRASAGSSARSTCRRAPAGSTTPRPRTGCSRYTDTEQSPWYVVEADDKRTARLNLISHLLSLVPYEHLDDAKRGQAAAAPAAQVPAPAEADRAPGAGALRRRALRRRPHDSRVRTDLMRVAVTGGSGLVGTRLVAALRARGDEVTLLSRSGGDGAIAWDPLARPGAGGGARRRRRRRPPRRRADRAALDAAAREAIRASRIAGTANLVAGDRRRGAAAARARQRQRRRLLRRPRRRAR